MLKSKVSVRGQTVIPQEIREKLGIRPNSELAWWVEGKTITLIPLPKDPIAASWGMFAGRGYTLEDFLRERAEERKQELGKDEATLAKMRPKSRRTAGNARKVRLRS
jgi:AbrB family looped-hinge helix DNA binding protein